MSHQQQQPNNPIQNGNYMHAFIKTFKTMLPSNLCLNMFSVFDYANKLYCDETNMQRRKCYLGS